VKSNKNIKLPPIPEMYALAVNGNLIDFEMDERKQKYTIYNECIARQIMYAVYPGGHLVKNKNITLFYIGNRDKMSEAKKNIIYDAALILTDITVQGVEWFLNSKKRKKEDIWFLEYYPTDRETWDDTIPKRFASTIEQIESLGIKLQKVKRNNTVSFNSTEDVNLARLSIKELNDENYWCFISIQEIKRTINLHKQYLDKIVKIEHYSDRLGDEPVR
jgi:hypothetical protein